MQPSLGSLLLLWPCLFYLKPFLCFTVHSFNKCVLSKSPGLVLWNISYTWQGKLPSPGPFLVTVKNNTCWSFYFRRHGSTSLILMSVFSLCFSSAVLVMSFDINQDLSTTGSWTKEWKSVISEHSCHKLYMLYGLTFLSVWTPALHP